MIVQCGYCHVDTGGNHEWGCPYNPNTYPPPLAADTVRVLNERIARLTAERDALRADLTACAEALQLISECSALEYACTQCMRHGKKAFNRPGVQAVLKD